MKKTGLIFLVSTILASGLYAGGDSEAQEDMAETVEVTITTMDVPYTVDGQNFIGYLAYDASITEPVPGVLVVHEWRGINGYAKNGLRIWLKKVMRPLR
jgi:hypothetical protein